MQALRCSKKLTEPAPTLIRDSPLWRLRGKPLEMHPKGFTQRQRFPCDLKLGLQISHI